MFSCLQTIFPDISESLYEIDQQQLISGFRQLLSDLKKTSTRKRDDKRKFFRGLSNAKNNNRLAAEYRRQLERNLALLAISDTLDYQINRLKLPLFDMPINIEDFKIKLERDNKNLEYLYSLDERMSSELMNFSQKITDFDIQVINDLYAKTFPAQAEIPTNATVSEKLSRVVLKLSKLLEYERNSNKEISELTDKLNNYEKADLYIRNTKQELVGFINTLSKNISTLLNRFEEERKLLIDEKQRNETIYKTQQTEESTQNTLAIKKLQDEIASKESQIASLKSTKDRLDEDFGALTRNYEEITNTNKAYKSQLTHISAEIKKLEERLNSQTQLTNKQMQILKDSEAQYKITVKTLEDEIEKSKIERNENIIATTDRYKAEIEGLIRDKNDAIAKVKALSEEREARVSANHRELQLQKTAITEEYERKINELNGQIANEIAKHNDDVKMLNDELNAAHEAIRALETTSIEKDERLSKTQAEYEDKLSQLIEASSSTKSALELEQDAVSREYDKKIKELQNQLKDERATVKSRNKIIAQCNAQIKEINDEFETKRLELEGKIETLNAEHEETAKQKEIEYKAQISRLNDDLEKYREQYDTTLKNYQEMTIANDRLNMDYNLKLETIKSLENQIAKSNEQIIKTGSTIVTLELDSQMHELETEEFKQLERNLNAKISSLTLKYEDLQRREAAQQLLAQEAQTELQEAQARLRAQTEIDLKTYINIHDELLQTNRVISKNLIRTNKQIAIITELEEGAKKNLDALREHVANEASQIKNTVAEIDPLPQIHVPAEDDLMDDDAADVFAKLIEFNDGAITDTNAKDYFQNMVSRLHDMYDAVVAERDRLIIDFDAVEKLLEQAELNLENSNKRYKFELTNQASATNKIKENLHRSEEEINTIIMEINQMEKSVQDLKDILENYSTKDNLDVKMIDRSAAKRPRVLHRVNELRQALGKEVARLSKLLEQYHREITEARSLCKSADAQQQMNQSVVIQLEALLTQLSTSVSPNVLFKQQIDAYINDLRKSTIAAGSNLNFIFELFETQNRIYQDMVRQSAEIIKFNESALTGFDILLPENDPKYKQVVQISPVRALLILVRRTQHIAYNIGFAYDEANKYNTDVFDNFSALLPSDDLSPERLVEFIKKFDRFLLDIETFTATKNSDIDIDLTDAVRKHAEAYGIEKNELFEFLENWLVFISPSTIEAYRLRLSKHRFTEDKGIFSSAVVLSDLLKQRSDYYDKIAKSSSGVADHTRMFEYVAMVFRHMSAFIEDQLSNSNQTDVQKLDTYKKFVEGKLPVNPELESRIRTFLHFVANRETSHTLDFELPVKSFLDYLNTFENDLIAANVDKSITAAKLKLKYPLGKLLSSFIISPEAQSAYQKFSNIHWW